MRALAPPKAATEPELTAQRSPDLINGTVILVARTTASCARLPRGEGARRRRIYVTEVENGLVAEFHHYGEDADAVSLVRNF